MHPQCDVLATQGTLNPCFGLWCLILMVNIMGFRILCNHIKYRLFHSMVWEPGLSLKGKSKLNIISICLFLPPDYGWNYDQLPQSSHTVTSPTMSFKPWTKNKPTSFFKKKKKVVDFLLHLYSDLVKAIKFCNKKFPFTPYETKLTDTAF